MKKYILFAGDCYYPCGSLEDLIGYFNNIDQAKAAFLDFCKANSGGVGYQHIDVWGSIVRVGKRDMREALKITVTYQDPSTIKWERANE